MGKTVITAKIGKKTAKCTVWVNSTYIEIVKGKSSSITKVSQRIQGYKKATWKSSNQSVLTISKAGKANGLKHGKSKISAKINGKRYEITAYVYDNAVLKKQAITKLKSILKNPSSLIINNTKITGNMITIDYSAMNGFGGYNRDKFYAWYKKGKLISIY